MVTEPWDDPSPWTPDVPPAPTLIGQMPSLSDESGETPSKANGAAQGAYFPAQRFQPGDASVRFELRLFLDGRSALVAYSSLDLLVAGCGEAQPWVAVRLAGADGLAELARLCGADEALWDVNVPPESRHGAAAETDQTDSGEVT